MPVLIKPYPTQFDLDGDWMLCVVLECISRHTVDWIQFTEIDQLW